ncbi:MAG: hypothetical protein QM750_27975 [Rubrivivax sp.]
MPPRSKHSIALPRTAALLLALALAPLAQAATTTLAFARGIVSYCPTLLPACALGYTLSEEQRSWDSGDFSPSLTLQNPGMAHTLNAFAAVDLAQGTLKIASEASGINLSAKIYGSVDVRLGDTLTLLNADGTPYLGSGTSSVHLDIDGLVDIAPGVDVFGSFAIVVYSPGYFEDFSNGVFDHVPLASQAVWMFSPDDPLPSSLDLDFVANGPFELEFGLWLSYDFTQDAAHSLYADFDLSHTATASFSGPPGTIFTSASGLFPGSAAAAVPLPGSAALAALGLAVLGLPVGRRRTLAATQPA